jgi:predicted MFS family arabinose efflux permease
MVSEYANAGKRSMAMSLLHSGFTVGMMLGGLCAALVLEPLGWRAVFTVGAVMNAVLLAFLVFFMWESPRYLLMAQPRNALSRLNKILTKIGQPALDALPLKQDSVKGAGNIGAMLGPELRWSSAMLWSASLGYAIVGYFLLNWKPVVFVDAGLTPTQAAYSSVFTSVTGVLGHIAMGALCRKGGEGKWTAVFFACQCASLIAFGNLTSQPLSLILMGAVLQFFTVGAYTGIFLVAVAIYAPAQRSVGVGFVTGFSRVGSIIGPYLGGVLMSAGLASTQTFGVFASIAVLPALLMFLLSRRKLRAGEAAEAAA